MSILTLVAVAAIAVVVIGLVIAGMAIGVIFSNRRIKGSCGGLSSMQRHGGSPCEVCGNSPERCEEDRE